MPFPEDSNDILIPGLDLKVTEDYTLEALNGKKIDLRGDVRINGVTPATDLEVEAAIDEHAALLSYVSVKEYDIVGDGSDEWMKLNAAIIDAINSKRNLYIPPDMVISMTTGTETSTNIIINSPIKILFGKGAGLRSLGGTRPFVEVRSSNVIIEGGIFNKNGFGAGTTESIVFYRGDIGGSSSGCVLKDATLVNTTNDGYGFLSWDMNELVVDNVATSGTKWGIYALALNVNRNGCKITNCNVSILGLSNGKGICVDVTGTGFVYDNVFITHNRVKGPATAGLDNMGIETFHIKSNPIVENNIVEQVAYGISIGTFGHSPVISNNTVKNTYRYAIESPSNKFSSIIGNTIVNGQIAVNSAAVTTVGVSIIGNTIDGTYDHAVYGHAIHCHTVQDVVVAGNNIKATNTVNAMHVIRLQSVLRATVVGNHVDAGAGVNHSCVHLDSASISTVTGNTFRNVATAAMHLFASAPITDTHIYHSNTFESSTGVEHLVHANVTLSPSSRVETQTTSVFGTRYLELTELTADPAAPQTNRGRIFFRDNGSGKTQVCVRFPTGAVQILATEP